MMNSYKNFTLPNWLDFLENRHQQEIQLGLSRVRQVAESLDLLTPSATVITVAGTNGKGSTVAALESIYLAAGYQVASYTSPHLLNFRDRIKVNKKPISNETLIEAFCLIEEKRKSIHLTYFEMTTLAALWYFKQHALDLIILEVGMGGRLDATNIIDTNLAIITTIDFDHQPFLGNDRESIAYQKAGILRESKPVIYADNNPPQSILQEAASLHCPLYVSGKSYKYICKPKELIFYYQTRSISLPLLPLHPNSITAALMACFCLNTKLPIIEKQMVKGLNQLALPGRLQWVKGRINTLFDVSHNPQSVNYLAKTLKDLNWTGKIHAVFSALKDKDIPNLIAPLIPLIETWYPALLSVKRAASREQFSAAYGIYGIMPFCYINPLKAYEAACQKAKTGDLIVVYGSFITVEQVLVAISNTLRRYHETGNG